MKYINKILFYLFLIIFSILTNIAFGKLYHAKDIFLSAYFSLFIILLLTYYFYRKIFYIISSIILILAIIHSPVGLTYGKFNFGIVASIYETNRLESIEYLTSLPYYIYAFILLLIISFIIMIYTSKSISPYKNKLLATISTLITLIYCFYNSIIYAVNIDRAITASEFLSQSRFYLLSILSSELNVNASYLEQRDFLQKAIHEPPTWEIIDVKPKYKNYVLIIGESMRSDYMSLYGYPIDTTPFLRHVNGHIFKEYIAAGPNTQASLQRTLYRNKDNQTIYTDNIITLANKANIKTYWLSNQGNMGIADTIASRVGNQASYFYFTKKYDYDMENIHDTKLLPEFKKALGEHTEKTKLIVLHLIGSHPSFCERVINKPQYHLNNSSMSCYLQSLIETDELLSNINSELIKTKQTYSVIYFSDHGLSHKDHNENVYMRPYNKYKQNFLVPFIKFSSDDTSQNIINNPQSAFNFIHGFAQWLGIKEKHLSQDDFFNPKQQNIKVFDWQNLVDFDSLQDDPALLAK